MVRVGCLMTVDAPLVPQPAVWTSGVVIGPQVGSRRVHRPDRKRSVELPWLPDSLLAGSGDADPASLKVRNGLLPEILPHVGQSEIDMP